MMKMWITINLILLISCIIFHIVVIYLTLSALATGEFKEMNKIPLKIAIPISFVLYSILIGLVLIFDYFSICIIIIMVVSAKIIDFLIDITRIMQYKLEGEK